MRTALVTSRTCAVTRTAAGSLQSSCSSPKFGSRQASPTRRELGGSTGQVSVSPLEVKSHSGYGTLVRRHENSA